MTWISFQDKSKTGVRAWNPSTNLLGSSENWLSSCLHWSKLVKEKGICTLILHHLPLPWESIKLGSWVIGTPIRVTPEGLVSVSWDNRGYGGTYEGGSVQSLSRVWLFATPWITAHQASLSITNSRSSLKLMSTKSVMPSNHLILCHPLLLPSIFPSIRVFSNESTLRMRWPVYWSFSFRSSPSNEYPGLIFRMDWLDLLAVLGLSCLLWHHSSKA